MTIIQYCYQAGPIKQSAAIAANSYEWKDELFGCDFLAAPVSLFKHAPLHEMWDSTFEGMKVEVKNNDIENSNDKMSDYFWVATVLKVSNMIFAIDCCLNIFVFNGSLWSSFEL